MTDGSRPSPPYALLPKRRLTTQVDLLNALGHPWGQERVYLDQIQADRHAHGAHGQKPNPACPTCDAEQGHTHG